MKFFSKAKDGGPYSTVTAYWLFEIKRLGSVGLLHFAPGTRENHHSHAFHAVSWLLKGELEEKLLMGSTRKLLAGLKPIFTWKNTFHKVFSHGDSWALTFRGPWEGSWFEYNEEKQLLITLANGREVINEQGA